MFKFNREICDLIDLLSAVNDEAEAFARKIGPTADVEILAKDDCWSLKLRYGDKRYLFYREYETVEELREELRQFLTAAKLMMWEEV